MKVTGKGAKERARRRVRARSREKESSSAAAYFECRDGSVLNYAGGGDFITLFRVRCRRSVSTEVIPRAPSDPCPPHNTRRAHSPLLCFRSSRVAQLALRWPTALGMTPDQIKKMYTNEKRRMRTKAQRGTPVKARRYACLPDDNRARFSPGSLVEDMHNITRTLPNLVGHHTGALFLSDYFM